MKKCCGCEEILPENKFYKRSDRGSKKIRSHCKVCFSKSITLIQSRKRDMLKTELGNKCQICGYNRCKDALDFHHTGEKTGVISKMVRSVSYQKLLKEIENCILVCANCHREIHAWGCRSGQSRRP